MDPIAQLIVAALGGFVVGLLVMWLARRGSSGKQQQQHEALQQQFADYRRHVDRHFVDTAAAVDELNRSYQKVVQHLSQGAQNLMGKEALQEQLSKRTDAAVTLAYLAAEESVGGDADADGAVAAAAVAGVDAASAAARPSFVAAVDFPPPPPYTDATEAEVVPVHGQPDRVPDRIDDALVGVEAVSPAAAAPPQSPNANEPVDLHKPKV